MRNVNKLKAIVLLLLIVFFGACVTEKNYDLLSFVFDGVPAPDTLTNEQKKDTTASQIAAADSAQIITGFLHLPYQNNECNSCHNRGMGQTSLQQPDLCYVCHDNFSSKYTQIHGPAAGGYCTSCHNPHKAEHDHLLNMRGTDLCYQCHSTERAVSADMHALTEGTDCTECHNPHGESNKVFLKSGTCYQCHDDFNEKYAVLHGPAAGEFCYTCHESHSDKSEYKLLTSGQALCLNCHKQATIINNENHFGIEDADCTMCHNPHGGSDRSFMR